MSNTLQIKFAFAPECKAVINGTEKAIKILGNRGGNLLFRCLDDNSLYEVKTPFAGADNTMEFEVVETDKTFTVTVNATGSECVTAVATSPAVVSYNGTATFTLTFASGKTAADIEVSGGSVSGTTLTVKNVLADTTITITDKA